MWRSENDLRGQIWSVTFRAEKTAGNSEPSNVTMCCFKFTQISGIAFGIGEQHSEVERAL